MSTPSFSPLRALAFLLGAQVFLAVLDASSKWLAADMGIPLIAAVRHGTQVVLMLAVLGPRLRGRLWRTRRPFEQVARGLVLGAFSLTFVSSLRYLPQAEATAIIFVGPLVVMLLAGPLLGESVGRVRWVGAVAGFLGMLVVVRPGGTLAPLGIAFGVLAIACNVAFQLLTRRLAVADEAMTTLFISALSAALLSAVLLPWQDAWGGWPDALGSGQVATLLALGVLGALGQWLLLRAFFWAGASFLAPLSYLQLWWSGLTGWWFFGQVPDGLSAAGMVLIAASGIGVMGWEARAARRGRDERR
ncbi:MAG: EamA family transporter [Gammaproteobacteria bacterium]|nr:EamA family transporter [Gammaproteobacteria bacterium]MCP5200081.1 EamA family transporter [Gammaproteobacteria bacterium]